MYELELTNACYKLLHDMFDLQPGESLAITCDTESNMDVVNATAKAAFALGAKPLVLKMSTPRDCGLPIYPDDSHIRCLKEIQATKQCCLSTTR